MGGGVSKPRDNARVSDCQGQHHPSSSVEIRTIIKKEGADRQNELVADVLDSDERSMHAVSRKNNADYPCHGKP